MGPHPPMAASSTASLSLHSCSVSAGSGWPVASIAAPPINPSSTSKLSPSSSPAALSSLTATSAISGPMPSPGSRAILCALHCTPRGAMRSTQRLPLEACCKCVTSGWGLTRWANQLCTYAMMQSSASEATCLAAAGCLCLAAAGTLDAEMWGVFLVCVEALPVRDAWLGKNPITPCRRAGPAARVAQRAGGAVQVVPQRADGLKETLRTCRCAGPAARVAQRAGGAVQVVPQRADGL